MTAEITEMTVSHCRACHQKIALSANGWSADGDYACAVRTPDGLMAPHQPVPHSAVTDAIVPWHEVDCGELVVHVGKLVLLEAMWPAGTIPGVVGIRTRHEGWSADSFVDSNALTAVRRYVEG